MDLMLLYLALNQLVLTFAPAVSNYRTLKFNLTVTNNRNITSIPSTVTVKVQPTTNSPPLANAGPDQRASDSKMIVCIYVYVLQAEGAMYSICGIHYSTEQWR